MNREIFDWTGPHGLPRFDLIADEDFAPAFDAALAEAEAAHDAIAANPAAPDFANTIAALETADEPLSRVAAIFYSLAGLQSNDRREALQRELAPRLAAHHARIAMDPRLFARVQEVAERADSLAPQDRRITELALRDLRRAGAALDPAARKRMADLRGRLATLTTEFSQHVLTDEREFVLPVPDDRLGGLPADLLAAMRAAARERGMEGQVVTLARSLIVPFLEHSADRALREAAWRGWAARGSGQGAGGAATDNRAIVAEILALRHERAQLLGYPDFAAFKLETEMAQTADQVQALLDEVWAAARPRVLRDEAELTERMARSGTNGPLESWDWRFHAAARRRDRLAVDDAEVKPYLPLDGMIAAAFDVAGRLFGLTFTPFDAPLWDAHVRAWDVRRDGRHMAVLLGDYFARPGKRSGAWCSALQPQHRMGDGQRAIVLNACNFTPPAGEGAQALLSWDDARTLFHEFGHALHHMLSDVDWPSISGTSVARDFVELPSQLFEHWLEQPEVLDTHARHVATGEPLPAALRERILAAEKADAGFATTEYLESAMVDIAFHLGAPPADPMDAQTDLLGAMGAPKAVPMRHATPHFTHVFSGDGYSAGYYSYLWSEVMDADAFAAFRETGDAFDRETAQRLERAILSQGGARPADELWTEFRGRKPGVEPLLCGRGLLEG
ncbi:M3 family metallopeptidase [Paracoccus sp. Z118]|uniref:M3 family metallopeptidase n=1 Tax=Paracoccus sp. Z118 TaxID=2851017 RepID=UPI001C2B78BF|nr:M3 family metallopeptidase [Paracoccus sp. Z118]MBV0891999.1 M3 family metallopeptidase [Paracoccus sp. Z118]